MREAFERKINTLMTLKSGNYTYLTMIQTFVHKSEGKNIYIYDDQSRLSMLVHPEFEKACEKSVNVNSYYSKKYRYLRKYGFFAEPKPIKLATLNESIVERGILQTQQIVFEVTNSCNLNCVYCAQGELYDDVCNKKKIHRNVNNSNAINLVKYIIGNKPPNKHNRLSISFYGGEPLLNADFIKQIVEVVNLLKSEKEIDIDYFMTTNATLIHKHIDFLVSNKFKLLISLDGNEENHSYRVFKKNNKNSFQRVINNLDMVQRNYPEYFSKYISFNAVLHNRNSIKDISAFISERYHKIPRISELNPCDINPDKKDIYDEMFLSFNKSADKCKNDKLDLSHAYIEIHTLYKELSEFLKYFSINYYVSDINALLHDVEEYLPTNTCLPFYKKILLTTLNKLVPCEKINYKYYLGEANQNIIIDIPEITRKYNFFYNQIRKKCQNCYAYKFCGICLFHIKNLDKLETEEFVCDSFYDQKKFQQKMFHIFSFIEKKPFNFFQILENVITE
jgi:uncharacterized protein